MVSVALAGSPSLELDVHLLNHVKNHCLGVIKEVSRLCILKTIKDFFIFEMQYLGGVDDPYSRK